MDEVSAAGSYVPPVDPPLDGGSGPRSPVFSECEAVRDIQKVEERTKRLGHHTVSMPEIGSAEGLPKASDISQPGAFRRNFLLSQPEASDVPEQRRLQWQTPLLQESRSRRASLSIRSLSFHTTREAIFDLGWSMSGVLDGIEPDEVYTTKPSDLSQSLLQADGDLSAQASATKLCSVPVTVLTWFKSFLGSGILYTNIYTHALMHTYAPAYAHVRAHVSTRACTHADAHVHTHVHAHAYTHGHTNVHTRA